MAGEGKELVIPGVSVMYLGYTRGMVILNSLAQMDTEMARHIWRAEPVSSDRSLRRCMRRAW